MKNNNFMRGVLFILLSVFSQNIFSSTNVSGIITQNTTWSLLGSPYMVLQTVIINEGVTLNIEPGVGVEFQKHTSTNVNENLKLIVEGQLNAIGTADNPIIFTSSSSTPASGDWDYIEFTPTAKGASYNGTGEYLSGSILQYVTIEYGGGDKEFSALYANRTAPYLNNVTIQNNGNTGIKYNEIQNEVIIDNSHFIKNTASSAEGFGGAIYSYETSITVNSSNFEANTAQSGYDSGGAIYSYSSPYSSLSSHYLTINNCSFTENYATSHGGAIYSNVPLNVNSSSFIGNLAYSSGSVNYGGAIFSDSLTIKDSIFSFNFAFDGGGAIFSYADSLIVNDSIFTGNYTFYKGSAIYTRFSMDVNKSIFTSHYSFNNDSILYSEEDLNVQNTLLSENFGGSAIHAKRSALVNNSTIVNTEVAPILVEFTTPEIKELPTPDMSESCGIYVSGNLSISNSNIYGNGSYDIRNNSDSNIHAANNYWGTTDEAVINLNIFDIHEDPDIGEVNFFPFLSSAESDAPPPTSVSPDVTDTNQSYDTVQKAYLAYYGRPGEPTGLDYWANRLYSLGGTWTVEILDAFGNSDEFQSQIGDLSASELITNIYIQLFNRVPDQAGLDYFVELLESGQSSLSQISVEILDAASGDDAKTILNKLLVSEYFTQKVADGMSYGSIQSIKAIISGVSSDPTLVISAYALIDSLAGQ